MGLKAKSTQMASQTQLLVEIDYGRLKLSHDWFSHNISTILTIRNEIAQKSQILEIGSYEGLSTLVLSSLMPKAKIDCVDTWEGSAEHFLGNPLLDSNFGVVEKNFYHNIEPILERVTVHKKTSALFFAEEQGKLWYDFAYIDGSHNSDDVLLDAISAFQALKLGGVMIFDDYAWNPPNLFISKRDHPSRGINTFLRFLDPREVKILSAGYQLIIKKT
jgi:predicted O-methyltransferase YrrM